MQSTMWVAALATAVATAFALYETYLLQKSIDTVPVPAQYLERS